MKDEEGIALALNEALKAVGRTHPNPAVGAVIVKAGKIVSTGFTSPAGGPHAEAVAIERAGKAAKGATIYVSLEPCAHHGRTPPCADAIIKAGIKRVVFSMKDPNPKVNGKGAKKLRAAGIEVVQGVRADDAEKMNRPFFKFMREGLPWVTLKAGITLDGKLATSTGKSKWITSEASRNVAHELRDVIDAIVVGAGTVEADDPALTTRLKKGRNAVRVVIDPALRTKAERQVFDTKVARTILVTPHLASRHAARGVEVWNLTKTEDILRKLASEGLLHVMVEGGAFTHAEFLKAGLFDELVLFIAPKLFGHDGLTWSGLLGIREPAEAVQLENLHAETVGEDLMITATRRR